MFIKRPKFTFTIFKQLPPREKRITIPTLFTLLRIALVPIIIGAMIAHKWGIASILFVLAVVSDLIDGLLARLFNEKTFLGACLDPIADKFLLVSCFFTLAFVQSPLFTIPLWFVLLILCKEVLQITASIIYYLVHGYLDVQPTFLGKLTTVFQMGFIMWLFVCYFFSWVPIKTYYTMLSVMVILVCASFIQYMYIGLRTWYPLESNV